MSSFRELQLQCQNMILTAPVHSGEMQVQSRKARTAAGIIACAAIPVLTVLQVSAATDLSTVLENLRNMIFFIFKAIGFIMAAWGIGQLVLAFKDEDANGKQRAVMLLVAGILLFSLETIFSALGIETPSLNVSGGGT